MVTELWLQLYFIESIDYKNTIQPSLIFEYCTMKTRFRKSSLQQKKASTKKCQSILRISNDSYLVNLKSKKDVKTNLMLFMCKNKLVANCRENICLERIRIV